MGISANDIARWFTYHPPTPEQAARYVAIRDAARQLAELIVNATPACADQTTAIRKLRECVMTANAAIACDDTH